MSKKDLESAKLAKTDEFYTRLKDIEDELKHYRQHFKGKVVYCNCDDPRVSSFFEYFTENFEFLGLKKLIATCYMNRDESRFSAHNSKSAVHLEYHGDINNNKIVDDDEVGVTSMEGDGDFRSEECVALLKESDIVVTNPPFSLFREYIAQLTAYNKRFLIIGNMNAVGYKEIFPLIQKNAIWLGNNSGSMEFRVPDHYPPRKSRYWEDETGQKWRSMGNTCWFTNLEHEKRNEELHLYKSYTPNDYPQYDNCDAIEVGHTKHIPRDCNRIMGVPITFLNKYNPDQFRIIRFRKGDDGKDLTVNGKSPYFRILIQRKVQHGR